MGWPTERMTGLYIRWDVKNTVICLMFFFVCIVYPVDLQHRADSLQLPYKSLGGQSCSEKMRNLADTLFEDSLHRIAEIWSLQNQNSVIAFLMMTSVWHTNTSQVHRWYTASLWFYVHRLRLVCYRLEALWLLKNEQTMLISLVTM